MTAVASARTRHKNLHRGPTSRRNGDVRPGKLKKSVKSWSAALILIVSLNDASYHTGSLHNDDQAIDALRK